MDSSGWGRFPRLWIMSRQDHDSSLCHPYQIHQVSELLSQNFPPERQPNIGFSPERYVFHRKNKLFPSPFAGIRAPRSARSASEKGEPYGTEAAEFVSRRCMQRDVEFEVETIDKSGGFIGTLYLNKENVAIMLTKEGLATVHSFSADGLSWVKQLYDAEVIHHTGLF